MKTALLLLTCFLTANVGAREYHVTTSGNDSNTGSFGSPFLTIQAAASIAMPGDIITVHEGVYRERINPARGGSSDEMRIIYQAAPGEKVVIKGSEVINTWEKVAGDTWKVIIPNSFFGSFNPYNDLIQGEWYATPGDGYDRHTGSVYLNEEWLGEAPGLEPVLEPAGNNPLWFARVDDQNTTIWAQFKGCNPNEELVEINVRQSIFYPDQEGLNYITVRGFTMRQAATPWSGAMSEQIGLIGTHWSKGWVIEENVISHSMNTGITLGRYDLGKYGIAMPEQSAPGYIESIKFALEHGWSRENIGSHVIRNNHISHCEKNGIHGSLGGIFSTIEGNYISDISARGWINGTDRAGIKLLGSHDVLIRGNVIVNCGYGIWLDWMAQGARVSANLFYRNIIQDLYSEVNHGPYLIDNNIFLSLCSIWDMSQGGAYVHNLIAGKVNMSPHSRKTPFHEHHSTTIAGYQELLGGDYRFYNNILVRGCEENRDQADPMYKNRLQYGPEDFGLSPFNDTEFPTWANGNVYMNGASTFENESTNLELAYDPEILLEESCDGIYFSMKTDPQVVEMKNQLVTTELLGKSLISGQAYTHPDGSPLTVDKDYLGNRRKGNNPVPGPFELDVTGRLKIKLWDKSTHSPKTIVVNKHMDGAGDFNPGTDSRPLKTIQAAANMARAGDTILVEAGIYREAIIPPRGGTRDKPITYLAAPGEEVSIRGSEQVSDWVKVENGLWMARIDNVMFHGFNPYTTNVSGAWLYGSGTRDTSLTHHLGDVYFNGEAYYEVFSIQECEERQNSWITEQKDGKTVIRANFGSADPNTGLSEINVRATAIFPEVAGLKHIVIDGFDIRQTASQWSDIYGLEEGAIGMKYGYGWVIQNCTISNSRNNGISMGVSDEVSFSRDLTRGGDNIPPYGSFGFHIIRNNVIKRCGQCGIYGCYGAVGSIIENNQFTETVYRNEWHGPNQADIKILFPVDVIIRHNKFHGSTGLHGRAVWLDWGSQNAQIIGNLIIDRKVGVFTEVSFGPTIVANNILIRSGVWDWSDGNIYAHNLFHMSPVFHLMGEPNRPFVPYYKPHSIEVAGRNETRLRHERWYNNIFIGGEASKILHKVDEPSGFLVNNNLYLDGEPAFPFEGDESIVDKKKSGFEIEDSPDEVSVSFKLSKRALSGDHPIITSGMIGKMPLPGVYMENPDGSPLDITSDYFGNIIEPENVKPGPFQKISAGSNSLLIWKSNE